jgi:aromatic-L-amino-acid/L-tryptophan decarboxylase
MDWGVQLGRRFRSLKLWAVIRYFGADGLAARIREHVAQAQRVVAWVERHPDLVLAAPAPLSTVCFRSVVSGEDEDEATARNRAWLAAINATGEAFLSHTVLDGVYVLRLATGNLRTTDERLAATLTLLDRELTPLLP